MCLPEDRVEFDMVIWQESSVAKCDPAYVLKFVQVYSWHFYPDTSRGRCLAGGPQPKSLPVPWCVCMPRFWSLDPRFVLKPHTLTERGVNRNIQTE